MEESKLFYEDNSEGKRNLKIVVFLLIILFIVCLSLFIISFIIIGNSSFLDNLAENIFDIIFLIGLLALIIYSIYSIIKSDRFKYSITITENEICFSLPINGINKFKIEELNSFEIQERINNYAKIKLIFNNNITTTIRTRKYDNFINILEFVRAKHSTII